MPQASRLRNERARVAEITTPSQPAYVVGVGLQCGWINVGRRRDRETCFLKSKAQTASSGEQVNRPRARQFTEPSGYLLLTLRVGCIWSSFKTNSRPTRLRKD